MKNKNCRSISCLLCAALLAVTVFSFGASAALPATNTVMKDFEGADLAAAGIGADLPLTDYSLISENPLSGSKSLQVLQAGATLSSGHFYFVAPSIAGSNELWIRIKNGNAPFKFTLHLWCSADWGDSFISKDGANYKLISEDLSTTTLVNAAYRAANFTGDHSDKIVIPANFDGYVAVNLISGFGREGSAGIEDVTSFVDEIPRFRIDIVGSTQNVPFIFDDIAGVDVDQPGVSSVEVDATKTVDVGVTEQITAVLSPSDVWDDAVTWSITEGADKVSIAANGLTCAVTGVAAGTAKITVTTNDGAKTDVCDVTVVMPVVSVNVTGVTVDKSSVTVSAKGKAAEITATVAPANATDKTVTWSVAEGAEFVSIQQNGAKVTVTGLKKGSAKLKVVSVDGAKEATVNVTVLGTTPDNLPTKGVVIDDFDAKDPVSVKALHLVELGKDFSFINGGIKIIARGGVFGQFQLGAVEAKGNWTNGKYIGLDVKTGNKPFSFAYKLVLQDYSEYMMSNTDYSKYVLVSNGIAEEYLVTDDGRITVPANFNGTVLAPLTSGAKGNWKKFGSLGEDEPMWKYLYWLTFCDTSYEEEKGAELTIDNLALYGSDLKITGKAIALKLTNGGDPSGGNNPSTGSAFPAAAVLAAGLSILAVVVFRRKKAFRAE